MKGENPTISWYVSQFLLFIEDLKKFHFSDVLSYKKIKRVKLQRQTLLRK